MIQTSCKHELDFSRLDDEQALDILAACANGQYDTEDDLAPWRHLPRANGPIAPAVAEADDRGWHKGETWRYGLGSGASPDDRVGTSFETRYWKEVDGEFFVATEEYFVVTVEPSQARPHGSYGLVGAYQFSVCTDVDDVGGTEVWSDCEYDHGLTAFFCDDLAKAEALCRQEALSDQRHTLSWDGGIPVR